MRHFPKEKNFKFFSKNVLCFWALDIAPTLDVLVLLGYKETRESDHLEGRAKKSMKQKISDKHQ